MKKLKLAALNLGAKEILTREDLKNVLGGDDGSGSGNTDSKCSGKCSGVISTPNGTQTVTGTCDSKIFCLCSLTPGATVATDSCKAA